VQKRIYESVWRAPTDDEQEILEIFGCRIGWVWWHPSSAGVGFYDGVEEGTPPEHLPDEGHLPTYCMGGDSGGWGRGNGNVNQHRFTWIRKRLETCRV